MSSVVEPGSHLEEQQRLFLSLTERLSHFFLQIARLAEQSAAEPPKKAAEIRRVIETVSAAATTLTEAYTMDVRLRSRLVSPVSEVVTVSSLLHEVEHTLQPLAAQYGVKIAVDDSCHLSPVLGDPVILSAALSSLGQVFVQAMAELNPGETLRFAAHRTRYGVVAGVYMESGEVSTDAFRRAKKLYGKVSEPFGKLVSGPATGVFVADSLLQMVSAKLHVARYQHLSGLAVTLPVCSQLQLV